MGWLFWENLKGDELFRHREEVNRENRLAIQLLAAKNQELVRREVARFRESGFQVWMDDFGSDEGIPFEKR